MNINEEAVLSNLKLEDLEDNQKAIAEAIGIENFAKLVIYAGGDCYYIPTITKFKTKLMKRFIKESKKNINAYNRRELIRQFGVCRKTVDEVFAEVRREVREEQDIQLNFGV